MSTMLLAYVFLRSVIQVETQLLNDQLNFQGEFPFMLVVQQVLNSSLLIFCFLIPLLVNSTFYDRGMGPLVKNYELVSISAKDKVLGVFFGNIFILSFFVLSLVGFYTLSYIYMPLDFLALIKISIIQFLFVATFVAINLFVVLVAKQLVLSFLFSTLFNYSVFFTGDLYLTMKSDVIRAAFQYLSVPFHFSQAIWGGSITASVSLFGGLILLFLYISFRFESLKKWWF